MFGVTIFKNYFLKGHLDHPFLFQNFDTKNLEIFLEKLVILALFSLIKISNDKNVQKNWSKNCQFFLL
jgi:hypothetical protein